VGVVANGVDIEYFDAVPKHQLTDPTILFVGTFSWLPNVQAVNFLVNKIWPLILKQVPQARLKIVGFSPTPEIMSYHQKQSITVDGSVDDIRTAYAAAHVLVAPVMWGKGTRYKILEAMATHTPIVATPTAIEGIAGIKPDTHVLLGSDAASLAQQTVNLLTDTALQGKLADHSYELVKKRYNWHAISNDLDQIYQEIGSRS
jgi:polysaccharide biosynthesis protein PslH